MKHEALCDEIKAITCVIRKIDKNRTGCEWDNGKLGYIQHDPKVIRKVKSLLLAIAKRYVGDHDWLDNVDADPSWAARIIDESSCPKVVSDAWYKFYTIDNQGREWGQPFFRINPEKAPNQNQIEEQYLELKLTA